MSNQMWTGFHNCVIDFHNKTTGGWLGCIILAELDVKIWHNNFHFKFLQKAHTHTHTQILAFSLAACLHLLHLFWCLWERIYKNVLFKLSHDILGHFIDLVVFSVFWLNYCVIDLFVYYSILFYANISPMKSTWLFASCIESWNCCSKVENNIAPDIIALQYP